MPWNSSENIQSLTSAIRDAIVTLGDDLNADGADVLLVSLALLARSSDDPKTNLSAIALDAALDTQLTDPQSVFRQAVGLWWDEIGVMVTRQAIDALRAMPVHVAMLGSGEDIAAEQSIREIFLAAFKHRDLLEGVTAFSAQIGVMGAHQQLQHEFDDALGARLLRALCINDSRASIAASLPGHLRQQYWHWSDLCELHLDALAQHALGELQIDAATRHVFNSYLKRDADLARYLSNIAAGREQVQRASNVVAFAPRTGRVTLLPAVRQQDGAAPRLAAQDVERWDAIDVTVPPANVTLRITIALFSAMAQWIDAPADGSLTVAMTGVQPITMQPGTKTRLASLAQLQLTSEQSPREWSERLEELRLTAPLSSHD